MLAPLHSPSSPPYPFRGFHTTPASLSASPRSEGASHPCPLGQLQLPHHRHPGWAGSGCGPLRPEGCAGEGSGSRGAGSHCRGLSASPASLGLVLVPLTMGCAAYGWAPISHIETAPTPHRAQGRVGVLGMQGKEEQSRGPVGPRTWTWVLAFSSLPLTLFSTLMYNLFSFLFLYFFIIRGVLVFSSALPPPQTGSYEVALAGLELDLLIRPLPPQCFPIIYMGMMYVCMACVSWHAHEVRGRLVVLSPVLWGFG